MLLFPIHCPKFIPSVEAVPLETANNLCEFRETLPAVALALEIAFNVVVTESVVVST